MRHPRRQSIRIGVSEILFHWKKMISPMRGTFLVTIVVFFGLGLYEILVNVEENRCQVPTSEEDPEFLNIELNAAVRKKYPLYGLYFYGEGKYAQDAKKAKFRLNGIPVLFVPGSGGSHRHVQSFGSLALSMTKNLNSKYRFNFFAVDFNEELSMLFGPVLFVQTEFTHECIRHILSLYGQKRSNRPKSVLIIGHSMGGVVARALFSLHRFNRKLVNTVVTLGSPHQAPVVSFDPYMVNFYEKVNNFWIDNGTAMLEDISLVSISGGDRDVTVRSGLTSLNGIGNNENTISTSTMAIPKVWLSADHSSQFWCEQTVLCIVRALFDSVNKTTKQIDVSSSVRKSSFQYHLEKNHGSEFSKTSGDLMIQLDNRITWELRKRRSWKYVRDSVEYEHYSVVEINKQIAPKFGFVAISNVDSVGWVGACTLKAKETRCTQVGNFGRYAHLLPPQDANLKIVHLDGDRLDMFTHWVVMVPKSTTKMIIMMDLYNSSKRHQQYNVTTLSAFFWGFPGKIGHEDVVINATKPRTIFYKIDLLGLEIPLQAYTAHLVFKSCASNSSGDAELAIAKFIVPWTKSNVFTVIKRGEDGYVSLKLPSPKPDDFNGHAQLQLFMIPSCSYQLKIGISWQELLGQTVQFYGGFLPAYVVIQVLMALSWQLMMLDEQEMAPSFTASHLRWAQPYRVVIAALGIRFIFSYPEKENLMTKLGLPPDDVHELGRQNIWYPALPIILYLIAYAIVAIFVKLLNLLIAIYAKILSICGERFLVWSSFDRMFTIWQYLVLFFGLLGAVFFCGSLGVAAACLAYVTRMLVSYMKSRNFGFVEQKVWTRFNIDFSLALLLVCSLLLNMPSFLVWYNNLSWATLNLPIDPSFYNGVILCISVFFLVFSDFPITNNEILSIMGFISYLCAVTLVLMATVSLYRISYLVNATMMTIGLPAAVTSIIRARRMTKQKPE